MPFEKGWKVAPGGGNDGTSQDQGVITHVRYAFDGAVTGKSKAVFSDRQAGLP